MSIRFKVFIICCVMILPLLILSTGYTKPPKPGPHFIWVKPSTLPDGVSIPGYWKYTGPPKKGKTWVLGHYNQKREWIPGHWKSLPPKGGKVWVPGHRGPKGRWIPGHWR